MTQFFLIMTLAASVISFIIGAGSTYHFLGYRELKAENRVLKENLVKFRNVLGLNQSLDDTAHEANVTNQEIIDAIKAQLPPPVEVIVPGQCAPTVCVSRFSLRKLKELK